MKNKGLIFWWRNLVFNLKYPGLSGCGRCKGNWEFVEPHTTFYNEIIINDQETGLSAGCFPLCETCWTELATPEARLPFYEEWIREMAKWRPGNPTDRITAEQVRQAVLAGN